MLIYTRCQCEQETTHDMLSGIFVRRSFLSAFLFFILVSQCDGGNLLVRQNDITVKVGRTVYLNTDDIVFRKPRRGDEACRVEVVQNDPITQRVGQLEPKVSLVIGISLRMAV